MKVLTVLGTRPEIIRLSLVIQKLDQTVDQHIVVHTGQNFDYKLNEIFFEQLNVRKPDYVIQGKQQGVGAQLATMFKELEKIIAAEEPDKMLVLGDTNSALSAILAERMKIPVVHMEAGNRCFDLRVPEEKNRRVIDAVSTFNLPYTPRSKENLLKEGFPAERVIVSGNPIFEVLEHYKQKIDESRILDRLKLKKGDYFLVTAHRAETVDDPSRLAELLKGLNLVAESFQTRVICSIHPRTRSRLDLKGDVQMHPLVEFYEPFGFFDFVHLEKQARAVLTDSGTVQEECCLFQVPAVTMRDSTERPETIECGSNTVSGVNGERIREALLAMTQYPSEWKCPEGYEDPAVSTKIVKFIVGGIRVVE